MQSFRTCLKILAGHRIYILIYLVMLSVFALLVGLPSDAAEDAGYTKTAVKVAVIDRDGTALSKALAAHVEDGNVAVALDGTDEAIQDALAKDAVSYLLVIPEGWEAGLIAAAQDGSSAPDLETSVSYQSGQARLVDIEATSYADALYGLAAAGIADPSALAEAAGTAWSTSAKVTSLEETPEPVPQGVVKSALFSSYSLFSSIAIAISLLMGALRRPDIEQRLLAAPTERRSRSLVLFCACLTAALAAWGFNVVLQFVFLGQDAASQAPVQLALVYLGMLLNALNAAGIGYLLGQFPMSENAQNAAANVLGMVMSFLGGALIDLSYLPGNVLALAHLTPTYWVSSAIGAASKLTAITPDALCPIFQDFLVALLFAAAFMLSGMVLSSRRAQGRA